MIMQLKPIKEQVVVLVGASSGIGRETALKFAKRGAKVVVAARSQAGLDSLVDEIKSFEGDAVAIAADVSDFKQVQAIANKAIDAYGRIDTWVHLAAVSIYASFEDTTPEEFKRIIDVNLMGQVYGAMVALPHLKRQGRGALIHISSVEAKRAFPLQSAYTASKHGINGFVEALRVELMHEKLPISVTEIMPASINTPLFSKARTKIGVMPQGAPPIYEPSIVADAILYAAEHPTRDIVVGDAGKAIVTAQKIAPQLLDSFFAMSGYDAQKTKEPKSEDAPDNLYEPISGYDTVEGEFRLRTQPSYSEWLDKNPQLKWGALAGLALGAIALFGMPKS
ncbi:MAG TPA: short-chain dehydrogenase [Cyanobacteria bacterium UBA11372]|nr:short-chain dehydrogenase [Cyanobacteria bacterium UBA11372]